MPRKSANARAAVLAASSLLFAASVRLIFSGKNAGGSSARGAG